VPGDLSTTQGRILAGLQRLATFQHAEGMFSIWCGGTPGKDITARVAHRLLGLRGLPFPASEEMLDRAGNALRKAKYRDNALLPLDRAFGQKMESVEDAVAYYFSGNSQTGNGQQEAAMELLRQTVRRDGDKAYWQAKSAWGGNLEVTADAARVMYATGDALFRPAFTFVTGRLVNGMLYSTADTRALVELLASLKFDPATRAVIDGQEVQLGEVTIGQEITALNDNLVVRLDEEIEINHLEPRADFQFSVKPSKTRLAVGERIQITVTPKEQTIAPLVRLFLPQGCSVLNEFEKKGFLW
jgi:tetratricopeptide (TPR) repeat protein